MTNFIYIQLLLLINFTVPQEELRFTHVFKQGIDTSCGISTTATLLNKYWNIPVLEADMYQGMLKAQQGDYTVSFATMSAYMANFGIQTRAYKMNWDELKDTVESGFNPIVVHYENPSLHFALLLHIENDYAFVADPAKGLEIINKKAFTKQYSGNALLSASRVHQKEVEYIQEVIQETQVRHERLQRVSTMLGRR